MRTVQLAAREVCGGVVGARADRARGGGDLLVQVTVRGDARDRKNQDCRSRDCQYARTEQTGRPRSLQDGSLGRAAGILRGWVFLAQRELKNRAKMAVNRANFAIDSPSGFE
jgi:hypothetical protein